MWMSARDMVYASEKYLLVPQVLLTTPHAFLHVHSRHSGPYYP